MDSTSAPIPGGGVLYLAGMRDGDDTFCADEGAWNVSRALEDCRAGRCGPVWAMSVAVALAATLSVETDPDKVRDYAARTSPVPPLIAVMRGGHAWLIDGHHRLRALALQGAEDFPAYVIEEDLEPGYRVQALRLHPDGRREDVTADLLR